MGIASMVLGIICLCGVVFFFWYPYFSIPAGICGVVGLILGLRAKSTQPRQSKFATVGIVCSLIAIGLCVLVALACTACVLLGALGAVTQEVGGGNFLDVLDDLFGLFD